MNKDIIIQQNREIEQTREKHSLLPRTRGGWYLSGITTVGTCIVCAIYHFDGGTTLGGLFVVGTVLGFSDDVLHALFYGKRFPEHLAANHHSAGTQIRKVAGAFAERWLGFDMGTDNDPQNSFKARAARWVGMPEPDYDEPRNAQETVSDRQEAVLPVESVQAPQATNERRSQHIPTGYELLTSGAIGNDILLGYDKDGKEIRRTWKQLKAILILGLQGGGKTSSATWLMAQALMQGARLAVIDKHAKSEEDSLMQKVEPFRPFFDCSPGVDPVSAWQVARHVRQVFNARLDGAPCSYPLLLVIDEFSAIMRQIKEDGSKWQELAKELASLIEALNEEGRKHKVYAICIGQATNASRSGGTEVRDLFNTRVAHGMREKQAEMLSLTDYKKAIRALEVGQALVDMEGRDEPFFVQVPYLSDGDIKALADFLRANNVSERVVSQLELPVMESLPLKAASVPVVPNNTTLNLDAILALAGKVSDETLLALIDRLPDVSRGDVDTDELADLEDEEEAEPSLLARGMNAYTEGHTTIDGLAVVLSITSWEARKLMPQIKLALKKEQVG